MGRTHMLKALKGNYGLNLIRAAFTTGAGYLEFLEDDGLSLNII